MKPCPKCGTDVALDSKGRYRDHSPEGSNTRCGASFYRPSLVKKLLGADGPLACEDKDPKHKYPCTRSSFHDGAHRARGDDDPRLTVTWMEGAVTR